ncbi:MAG: hypothetical protein D6677_06480 [Calditrichaeota bacterium]|nr:MAG: hypothetical protein D6677_06480 [Calditrichota bacterium]
MDPHFYKVIHLAGVFLLFMSLGGLIIREQLAPGNNKLERFILVHHGVALLLILVAGFGQLGGDMARLASVWLVVKMVVWLLMATMILFIKKITSARIVLWYLIVFLGATAAYMAIYKPI